MKRIVIVGAAGTLGRAVHAALAEGNEIITVGRSRGQERVDMTDSQACRDLFARIGLFDALVVTGGEVAFAPLTEMSDAQWQHGLTSKLMGQLNLTRAAIPHLRDAGSITLVSGILSDEPIASGSSACTINGAINHFVQAAACELPRGLRINAVSPTVLSESMDKYASFFPGFMPVPAERVAQAYRKSVLGIQSGRVYPVFG